MYPVITLGREYGSGGRAIGEKTAELLGIHYFNKELLALAAKESGIDYHVAGSVDEKPNGSFLYSIVTGMRPRSDGAYDNNILTLNDRLYIAQKNVIERLSESPCLIVGRCADYILRDHPNHISIFIYAPFEYRVHRVAMEYGMTLEDAKERVTKTDKNRAIYYKNNTEWKWGDIKNYSMAFDSSKMSIDGIASVIAEYVKNYDKKDAE